jgi:serine/threonine protein kinase
MLLDSHDTIKLADFAGSSIDDSEVSINYEVRSRLPNISKPTKKSDVFALGSAMYEMATGHPPYAKMSYSTIQNLYRKEKFPDDVDGIPILGKIIRKCWEQRFDTAHDVVRALGKTESQHRRPSQLQQRPEVFVDSGIWIPEQPEMVEIEESSSRTSRRHPATYVHQTSQRRHRPRERQVERFPEREKRKKHSQGAFSSWFNKSISTWTGPSKSSREKEIYY